jgi:hypothetical protein
MTLFFYHLLINDFFARFDFRTNFPIFNLHSTAMNPLNIVNILAELNLNLHSAYEVIQKEIVFAQYFYETLNILFCKFLTV